MLPRLLTFEEAANLLHDSVKVSSLQRARRDGRLRAKKIGGRYFTTDEALKEFLQCPDPESRPDSIFAATNDSGSFGTVPSSGGQDMALASANRLKQHLRNTSRPDSRPTAEVRRIRGN